MNNYIPTIYSYEVEVTIEEATFKFIIGTDAGNSNAALEQIDLCFFQEIFKKVYINRKCIEE